MLERDGGPGTIDDAGSVSTQDRSRSLPQLLLLVSLSGRACFVFSVDPPRRDFALPAPTVLCVCLSVCVVLSLSPARNHTLQPRRFFC